MQRIRAPWEIQRSLVVKADEETDMEYGQRPTERPLEEYAKFGVINLDKQAGPSSHEVTSWLKRILGLKKAGHSGTLGT